MRFSIIFQLYTIAACSSHALALGTTREQQPDAPAMFDNGAAVVQRDSISGSSGTMKHQPLQRRNPFPGPGPRRFGSWSGRPVPIAHTRQRPNAPQTETFYDANQETARQMANRKMTQILSNNPQNTDVYGNPTGTTQSVRTRYRRPTQQNEEVFYDAEDSFGASGQTARQRASQRMAQYHQANPQGTGLRTAPTDARQQAARNMAQLQRANSQAPRYMRSNQIGRQRSA
ncbi:hypothetical protein MCOR25_003713 [Pyricularia grisea]|nr:hypothetical protein MCOR25_003713 [Pyricularia grisea]